MVFKSIIHRKSFDFGVRILRTCRSLQKERHNVIAHQLLKSGTSIGANVNEATAGQSRKDFLHKMSIASKEARETVYWLELLKAAEVSSVDLTEMLELAAELDRILTAIVKTTSNTLNSELRPQNSELPHG
jgi:four helix bundle protein